MTTGPSSMGIHYHRWTDSTDQEVRSAPWGCIKVLDDPRPLQVAAEVGVPVRILRVSTTDALDAPAAAAAVLGNWGLQYATHVQLSTESSRSWDIQWQLAVMAGLDAGGYRGKYVCCGFPTGNPTKVEDGVHDPDPHFPELVAIAGPLVASRPGRVTIGFDAYFGSWPGEPLWDDQNHWLEWTAYRPHHMRRCLAHHGIILNEVVIPESSEDDVIPGHPQAKGWVARGMTTDQLWAAMVAVDERDRSEEGTYRLYFTRNASADWSSFEVGPVVPRMADRVRTLNMAAEFPGAIWIPSPNMWPGRPGGDPTLLVLHGTASPSLQSVINTFQDGGSSNPVAAHFCVSRQADPARPGRTKVIQFVQLDDRAWANGMVEVGADTRFVGTNPNDYSVSIETENNDSGNALPLTAEQELTLNELVQFILTRFPSIPRTDDGIIGHYRISPVTRMRCPGPNFDWTGLDQAIGISRSHPGDFPTAVVWPLPPDQGPSIHCGDESASLILWKLGKRPVGLTDQQWDQVVFARVHPDAQWTPYGLLTTPQQIVDGISGWFPDVEVRLLNSEADLEAAWSAGSVVEAFVRMSALDQSSQDDFLHFVAVEDYRAGLVKIGDTFRNYDAGQDWYPIAQFRSGEENAPTGPYGVAFTLKGQPKPMDPLTIARQQASLLGHHFVPGGLLEKAYVQEIQAWLFYGRPDWMNPGPLIEDECATATDSYAPLDCGKIYHATLHDQHVYVAEAKEHAAIKAGCHWNF